MNGWVNGTVIGKHQWSGSMFAMQYDAPPIDFKAGETIKDVTSIHKEGGLARHCRHAPGQHSTEQDH